MTALTHAAAQHIESVAPRRGEVDSAHRVAESFRALVAGWSPATDIPARWAQLLQLGRRDLTVARLVEGHADALWVLEEAGRAPRAGAGYGVWASASGGTGLTATREGREWVMDGVLRYASGVRVLDRALVTARDSGAPDSAPLLFDIAVRSSALQPIEGSWQAVGMGATESLDVTVTGLRVPDTNRVGDPGWYLARPGFHLGGAGVAAVWLGGAVGVLEDVVRSVSAGADEHQLAHVGAMKTMVEAGQVSLSAAAARFEAADVADPAALVLMLRNLVDVIVQEVLVRAPRAMGATPLCRDAAVAHRLADLAVYVRQHHAERDLARLGRLTLQTHSTAGATA